MALLQFKIIVRPNFYAKLRNGAYFKQCSLKFAFQYVEINDIKCLTQWKSDQIAGVDWMYGFMKRNSSLSLCKPENTSIARVCGFNKTVVVHFLENITNLLKKHNFAV